MTDVDNLTVTSTQWSVHGSENPEIVVAGHSHALALLSALDTGLGPKPYRGAVILDSEKRSSSFLNDEYWDLVARTASDQSLAILWNGNQHNASFLLEPEPAFRVFREGIENSGHGAWIAQEVLRDYWNPSFHELRAVLPSMVSVATVYILGTPPPKSDATIRSVIEQDPYFVGQATSLGMDINQIRITASSTRLAMWALLQDMLKECADEVGASYLPIPSEVTDTVGILLPEFSAEDATHANVHYGAKLWANLAREMRRDLTS